MILPGRIVSLMALAGGLAIGTWIGLGPTRGDHAAPRGSPVGSDRAIAPVSAPTDPNLVARPDPRAALLLAGEVSDPSVRAEAIRSNLRDWSSIDAESAMAWASEQRLLTLPDAARQIFAGIAAQRAAEAVKLERALAAQHPADAADLADCLITELQFADRFDVAAEFALTLPDEDRRPGIEAAYYGWARHDAAAAFASAARIMDAGARSSAVAMVLAGWANRDPSDLAAAALTFPAGPEQSDALVDSLRAWIVRDPSGARQWVIAHGSGAVVNAAERALDD